VTSDGFAQQKPGDEDARTTAHRYFRWSAAGWPVAAELPDPEEFAAASRHVSPEAIAETAKLRASSLRRCTHGSPGKVVIRAIPAR
jgi:hypothetical protein